jgi:ribosomal protein S18 acetylase RimI-like enzyme
VDIRRLGPGDDRLVIEASHLFDRPARPEAVARFLAEANHHLLVAYVDGFAAGFVSAVETTHPDKGTELFLYELAVDAAHRRKGVGRALVEALASLGRERGCYGMWVLAETDNEPALATYARAGGRREHDPAIFVWEPLP